MQQLFQVFNLNKNLTLNAIDESELRCLRERYEKQVQMLDEKYTIHVNSQQANDNEILIDYQAIIKEFDLKNLDSNLKYSKRNLRKNKI